MFQPPYTHTTWEAVCMYVCMYVCVYTYSEQNL